MLLQFWRGQIPAFSTAMHWINQLFWFEIKCFMGSGEELYGCGFSRMEKNNKSLIFSKSAQIFTAQSFNSTKEGYKAI